MGSHEVGKPNWESGRALGHITGDHRLSSRVAEVRRRSATQLTSDKIIYEERLAEHRPSSGVGDADLG